jgi:Mg/Co/Ni transporter MgtE
MLASQLITNNYPTVAPDDKIFLALQLMEDFDIFHVPVLDHNVYLGTLSKDILLDGDDTLSVQEVMAGMIQESVKHNEHFLSAVKLASQYNLSLVPVTNPEKEWVGAIPYAELLKATITFTGAEEQGR